MTIISIDPGESTGIVTWNPFSKVMTLVTVRLNEVIELIDHFEEKFVIVEGFPSKPDLSVGNLSHVHHLMTYLTVECEGNSKMIFPSAWKPVASAMQWKCPFCSTPHTRDAYLMLRYFLYIDKGKDVLNDSRIRAQNLDPRVRTDGYFHNPSV